MALMSATSCAFQSHVQAVCASRSSGGVQGVNDHAKDREAGSFDVGRLEADQSRHGLVAHQMEPNPECRSGMTRSASVVLSW